ncbi:MAG: N-acetylmuramoyl-L-alanine amidase [Bacteroidota bacterium]
MIKLLNIFDLGIKCVKHSLFVLTLLLALYSTDIQSQNLVDIVVIDAGHGGKDPGALGRSSREKDIVLSVALKAGELITNNLKGVKVVYTRKTDVFIPLNTRAQIANNNKADLFISIHCNSNTSSQPKGAETYVMGMHKSEENLQVAMLENSAILLEDDYKTNYEGFDPSSIESHIIFNFFQNSFQSQNLDIASELQSEFKQNTAVVDRGVKEAGFWVLYKTAMPGILIELGFLSNSVDEAYLKSEKGRINWHWPFLMHLMPIRQSMMQWNIRKLVMKIKNQWTINLKLLKLKK